MNILRDLRLSLIVVWLSIMIMGCVSSIKYGRMPDTERISTSLIQHVSTKEDVLKILGPPRGYGKSQMSSSPVTYVMWFYEYLAASAGGSAMKIDLTMLMVYFDKEIYEGHMWFSSFEKLEKIEENQ
jgi:hypothetical protein